MTGQLLSAVAQPHGYLPPDFPKEAISWERSHSRAYVCVCVCFTNKAGMVLASWLAKMYVQILSMAGYPLSFHQHTSQKGTIPYSTTYLSRAKIKDPQPNKRKTLRTRTPEIECLIRMIRLHLHACLTYVWPGTIQQTAQASCQRHR